jgi:hypothetical protein
VRRCRSGFAGRLRLGGRGGLALEHHRPARLLDDDDAPALRIHMGTVRTDVVRAHPVGTGAFRTCGWRRCLGRLRLAFYKGGPGSLFFFGVLLLMGSFRSGRGLFVAHSQLVKVLCWRASVQHVCNSTAETQPGVKYPTTHPSLSIDLWFIDFATRNPLLSPALRLPRPLQRSPR